tara:strand:- start:248 stop:787 length:540 start_codon:yes stop_codon:yes gene_type:complete
MDFTFIENLYLITCSQEECNYKSPSGDSLCYVRLVDSEINEEILTGALNEILEAELSGVVRYTHYSLMIAGPHRIPLVDFMKNQAIESLSHAQQVGEILTGFGGHPSTKVANVEETFEHGIEKILEESVAHERHAIQLYKNLLNLVEGQSVFLEEFSRTMISNEEQHQLELQKMLRDFA